MEEIGKKNQQQKLRELWDKIKILDFWIKIEDGRIGTKAIAKTWVVQRFGSNRRIILMANWKPDLKSAETKLAETTDEWDKLLLTGIQPKWWEDPKTPFEERPMILEVDREV